MKYKILLFLFTVFIGQIYAQETVLNGVVKDAESGLPLSDVSVTTTDFSKEVVTDTSGTFQLDGISEGDILIFSAFGYDTMEFDYKGELAMEFFLNPEQLTLLDDVVVIGYGSQVKKEITGAVSTVNSETLEQLKPVKVEQALQGTVS